MDPKHCIITEPIYIYIYIYIYNYSNPSTRCLVILCPERAAPGPCFLGEVSIKSKHTNYLSPTLQSHLLWLGHIYCWFFQFSPTQVIPSKMCYSMHNGFLYLFTMETTLEQLVFGVVLPVCYTNIIVIIYNVTTIFRHSMVRSVSSGKLVGQTGSQIYVPSISRVGTNYSKHHKENIGEEKL